MSREWQEGEAGGQQTPTNIFSPQFGYRLVQIRNQAVDGGGGSPAWKLPIWRVCEVAVGIMGKCCRCQSQQLSLGTWGLQA